MNEVTLNFHLSTCSGGFVAHAHIAGTHTQKNKTQQLTIITLQIYKALAATAERV
jgi:hypothetical protein